MINDSAGIFFVSGALNQKNPYCHINRRDTVRCFKRIGVRKLRLYAEVETSANEQYPKRIFN